ncbi:response regulator [Nucisporomicrobium flavum]|jgi:CheY-like chemotaxis protein|uniref:response regulator n=1 Tax=Nucisporomicrobium flavum TaxID=2785915 RepID=UPI003C2EA9E3
MAFIVVVDDDADVRELIETTLVLDGHEVRAVTGGPEALAAVRERQPDLLVTDHVMPGMTGLELVRALREDAATAPIPTILLTGTEKYRDLSMVDRWLEKPFSPVALRTHVQALLRRSASAR